MGQTLSEPVVEKVCGLPPFVAILRSHDKTAQKCLLVHKIYCHCLEYVNCELIVPCSRSPIMAKMIELHSEFLQCKDGGSAWKTLMRLSWICK